MSSGPRNDERLVPSILDRLIDDQPEVSTEPPARTGQIVRDIKASVRRDLENLLNTRWRCIEWPPNLDNLELSMVNYGIPDFIGAQRRVGRKLERLLEEIRRAIERYEPRLQNVRVEAITSQDPMDRTLRFRIRAMLEVDPIREKVAYRSEFETSTASFNVESLRE